MYYIVNAYMCIHTHTERFIDREFCFDLNGVMRVDCSPTCFFFKFSYVSRRLFCVKWSRSVMSSSVTPWTVAGQAPLSMEFSRQEYWSGLPLPSPGDLPDPGIKPGSPVLQEDSLLSEPSGPQTSMFFESVIFFLVAALFSYFCQHGLSPVALLPL